MNQAAPRRRPSEGGYARGVETRQRIIDTAIPLFGQRGYDGVSTREIAAEAGVNPPALQYYFDSKEGLYRACGEHIAEGVALAVEPVLARAERLLAEGAPRPALVEAYCAITETLAEVLFSDAAETWSPFMAAEQAGFGPGICFPIMRDRFVNRLQDLWAGLIGRLTGLLADAPETRLRMTAINGQLLIFHIGRRTALECLGWQGFTAEQARVLKVVVVEQTRTLLNSLAAG